MIGHPRVHHRLVDSTNRVARELAGAGAPHGTLVTADEQSAGRGRAERTWVAPAGSSVLMTVVLRPAPSLLPLRAAVAVARICGPAAAIKWPNDVLLDGRKVCGILAEGRPQENWAALGIGLNVTAAPPGFGERATCLAEAGDPRRVPEVLDTLVAELDTWLGQPQDAVLDAWRERDALRGSPVRWATGEGTAVGVDEGGALLVETEAGRVALDAGEVHLVT
jgi:BirA family transcriptional regulator, biotin operon repressor / biotin---[acetyl-CoA-carboxylase] ligase